MVEKLLGNGLSSYRYRDEVATGFQRNQAQLTRKAQARWASAQSIQLSSFPVECSMLGFSSRPHITKMSGWGKILCWQYGKAPSQECKGVHTAIEGNHIADSRFWVNNTFWSWKLAVVRGVEPEEGGDNLPPPALLRHRRFHRPLLLLLRAQADPRVWAGRRPRHHPLLGHHQGSRPHLRPPLLGEDQAGGHQDPGVWDPAPADSLHGLGQPHGGCSHLLQGVWACPSCLPVAGTSLTCRCGYFLCTSGYFWYLRVFLVMYVGTWCRVSLLQDYDVSIRGLASSTLGSILGTYTLSALLSERSSHPPTFFCPSDRFYINNINMLQKPKCFTWYISWNSFEG